MTARNQHLIFAGLIGAYVLIVWLCGLHLRLFTTRQGSGLGLDYFVLSAWITCYARGPSIPSGIDPHPFRSTVVFLGVLGMILTLGAKLFLELAARGG